MSQRAIRKDKGIQRVEHPMRLGGPRKSEYNKLYYIQHRETEIIRRKIYKDSHKEEIRRYYYDNKERILRQNTIYRNGLRERLFHILDKHICTVCGCHDKRVLAFHHINNDGSEDRKVLKAQRFYIYYMDHPDEARQKLDVVCHNCNHLLEVYMD